MVGYKVYSRKSLGTRYTYIFNKVCFWLIIFIVVLAGFVATVGLGVENAGIEDSSSKYTGYPENHSCIKI
jgi:hypothetical protein